MLFWLLLTVLIIGIALWCFSDYAFDHFSYIERKKFLVKILLSDFMAGIMGISIILGGIGVGISLFIFGVNALTKDASYERYKQYYESLVYQYENDFYDNDNDVGKYQLMDHITDWNVDLSGRKARQDNFWIGIYSYGFYDDFEFIELNGGSEK